MEDEDCMIGLNGEIVLYTSPISASGTGSAAAARLHRIAARQALFIRLHLVSKNITSNF
uniref:Uncharacterized protein n=1 Tax=Oryza sativa subsp. japonica TaxID=39947 RepID=Q69KM2_ORYSJ|nr:hypothetical protein [Oryza sativa Japonica Group]BAD72459.1 hypothetical protein [Oryza sativa Japonica Group]